jgi:hypothetical protein
VQYCRASKEPNEFAGFAETNRLLLTMRQLLFIIYFHVVIFDVIGNTVNHPDIIGLLC